MDSNLQKMLECENADDVSRTVLQRVFPFLERAIPNADKFFSAGSEGDAYPLERLELGYWNQAFSLSDVILDGARSGKLVVPDFSFDTHRMIKGEFPLQPQEYESRALASRAKRVRININPRKHGEIPEGYIVPFSPKDMTIMVNPELYFGGMGRAYGSSQGLYNAILMLEFRVFDAHGRPVLDVIPGTINNCMRRPEVYSPFRPLNATCWFNTTMDLTKPNSLEVTHEGPQSLMISARLHNGSGISSLAVPDNDKVKLFFWQVYTSIKKNELSDAMIFPPEKKFLAESYA